MKIKDVRIRNEDHTWLEFNEVANYEIEIDHINLRQLLCMLIHEHNLDTKDLKEFIDGEINSKLIRTLNKCFKRK